MVMRDKMELLSGQLDYGEGYPVVFLSHLPPILFCCLECKATNFHVVGQQATGLTIKIPFMSQPLASTGMGYHLVCNTCSKIARQLSKASIEKLERRILPAEICHTLDAVFAAMEDAPLPYSVPFPRFFVACDAELDSEIAGYAIGCLSAYRREDGRS